MAPPWNQQDGPPLCERTHHDNPLQGVYSLRQAALAVTPPPWCTHRAGPASTGHTHHDTPVLMSAYSMMHSTQNPPSSSKGTHSLL